MNVADLRQEAERYGTCTQVTSLLLRIVQCNRIKMYIPFERVDRCNLCGGGRLYFIVTENIFYKYLCTEAQQLRETQNLLANPHLDEACDSAVEAAEKKLQVHSDHQALDALHAPRYQSTAALAAVACCSLLIHCTGAW